jgi:hypothetical protein
VKPRVIVENILKNILYNFHTFIHYRYGVMLVEI